MILSYLGEVSSNDYETCKQLYELYDFAKQESIGSRVVVLRTELVNYEFAGGVLVATIYQWDTQRTKALLP